VIVTATAVMCHSSIVVPAWYLVRVP
jgi:hypothetical protein